MAKVIVDVMLKPEILDPQGRTVKGALTRLGLAGVEDVRQGKRFEIDLDGTLDGERAAQVERLAEELLANPVIEEYRIVVPKEDGELLDDPTVEVFRLLGPSVSSS